MCVFALVCYSGRGLEGKKRALWWSSDGVICCLVGVMLPIDSVQTVQFLGRAKRKGEWGQNCYINQLTKGINTKLPPPFSYSFPLYLNGPLFRTLFGGQQQQSWKCHFCERRGGPGFLSPVLLDLGKAALIVFFSNWNPTYYLRS